MADFDNDIDQIFKSRFDGLRDESSNPTAHWASVESGLSEPALSTGAASTASFSVLKIAASVATIALISSISSDQLSYNKTTRSEAFEQVPTRILAPSAEKPVIDVEYAAEYSMQSLEETNADHPVDHGVAHVAAQKSHGAFAALDTIQSFDLPSNEEIASSDMDRALDTIEPMATLLYSYENPTIDDPKYAPENPLIQRWQDDHIWFFRGGARTGMGESNSYAIDAEWAINPTFAFGYGVAITDKSFMSIEIGLIRRSGNGIERMRQRNIDPEVASFANTANSELDVRIHNGLIATRMDYIHFPLQYNYLAGQNWNVSVGGFMDYLISARNQSVVVYNSENYIAVSTRSTEVNSLDGLNKFRYGAMAGVERRLSDHFSTYAQVMVPINDPIDLEGGFESFGETNRLIDGQLGMKYNF